MPRIPKKPIKKNNEIPEEQIPAKQTPNKPIKGKPAKKTVKKTTSGTITEENIPKRPVKKQTVFDFKKILQEITPSTPYSGFGTKEEKGKTKAIKEKLEQLISVDGKVIEKKFKTICPYVIIRTQVGDNGSRPLIAPQTPPPDYTPGSVLNSPDIWIYPGYNERISLPSSTPDAAPANPGARGDFALVGKPNIIYAHVWNLGSAPIGGVRVEFYCLKDDDNISKTIAWQSKTKPSAEQMAIWCKDFEASNNYPLISVGSVDLAPRVSSNCHALVKCPVAWVPSADGYFYRLTVRVSCLGDPAGDSWNPRDNRHIASRIVAAGM